MGAELFRSLIHADRGLAGTTIQLVRRPGKVLDEYLSGKRQKYQPPFRFFLIWVAVCILTQRLVIAVYGFQPVLLKGLTFSNPESVQAFISHGQWFYILTFPVSAGLFFLILARPLFSYIESFVIVIYSYSVTYAFFVVSYLLGGAVLALNLLHWKFYLFQIILSAAYMIWVAWDLLRKKPVRFLALRIAVYMLLSSVIVLNLLELMSILWVKLEALN